MLEIPDLVYFSVIEFAAAEVDFVWFAIFDDECFGGIVAWSMCVLECPQYDKVVVVGLVCVIIHFVLPRDEVNANVYHSIFLMLFWCVYLIPSRQRSSQVSHCFGF